MISRWSLPVCNLKYSCSLKAFKHLKGQASYYSSKQPGGNTGGAAENHSSSGAICWDNCWSSKGCHKKSCLQLAMQGTWQTCWPTCVRKLWSTLKHGCGSINIFGWWCSELMEIWVEMDINLQEKPAWDSRRFETGSEFYLPAGEPS